MYEPEHGVGKGSELVVAKVEGGEVWEGEGQAHRYLQDTVKAKIHHLVQAHLRILNIASSVC